MPISLNEKYAKKKNRVKKKHLMREMARVERQVAAMPKSCASCAAPFDPQVPGALDAWQCTFGSGEMTLKCPECQRDSSLGVTPTDR